MGSILLAGDPTGTCQRHPRHGGGFHGQGHQVLGVEVVQVRLATGAGHGLRLQYQHAQVVGQVPAALYRFQALGQLGVLGGDAGRVLAVLPVVVEAGGRADLLQLFVQAWVVVAQGDQRRRADGYRIGTQGHGLGHVGTVADTAGDDQLYLAMHVHLLQRLHGLRNGAENGDADVLDKHLLGRRRTTLHAVEDDHIGTGLHRQLDVVVRTAGTDLHVDGFFPVGDFPQLGNLDRQVVRAGPVRVTAGAALVDANWQGAHAGDPFGDLHAQQHPATAGLGTLAENDLDGVGLAQVVRVHAVA